MNRLLSVIVPAHNEEKTICKTVGSLLRQNYKAFEVIVVNDGSKDDTSTRLIEKFKLEKVLFQQRPAKISHKRITAVWENDQNGICLILLEKENGGKGDALNAGIDFCCGEFFICIDADCILAYDTLTLLSKKIDSSGNVAAVGGAVLPTYGIRDFLNQETLTISSALQGFQELEYGKAFYVTRPFFDRLGTTMLISGALGLFNKELVLELGGYASDTVGEDMELVMRIRRYSADNRLHLEIRYTPEAICYTELPWIFSDWCNQRARWTVGLTEVLWKYREVVTREKYRLTEKITFWYYLLFEKFSPHIEFFSMMICLKHGKPFVYLPLMAAFLLFQAVCTLIASFKSVKKAVRISRKKIRAVLRLILLLFLFVTVYRVIHSFVRMFLAPKYKRKRKKSGKSSSAWTSPQRM